MDNIIQMVSAFILGLAVVAPFLLKAKQTTKEVGELLLAISNGIDDGKLSLQECQEIAKEAGDILGIFKK